MVTMLKRNLIIVAPAYTRSGYGSHARDIIKALWDTNNFNIRLVPTGWAQTSATDLLDDQMTDILAFCSKNVNTSPENAIHIHVGIPTEFEKRARYNVGITAGIECESLTTEWVEGCNKMDLVVVPSNYMKRTFMVSGVRSKVIVCAEGVDTSIYNTNEEHSDILDGDFGQQKITTSFNLLCTGQWLPYDILMDRKQIGYTIKSFIDTFKYEKDVGLILKTFTHNTDTPDAFVTNSRIKDLLKTYEDKEGIPPIYVVHGDLSEEQMSSLYKDERVKGFFTLTSGEGWGRSLAEAAACGLPVIAPKYSSYLDFLNDDTSLLLPVTLQPVPPIVIYSYRGMFPNNARWAIVPADKATEGLKKFKHNYDVYKEKAMTYAPVFAERFSREAAYKVLIDELITLSPGAVEQVPGLKLVKF